VNFLLDTCVVSESTKPIPNVNVMKWLSEIDQNRVFISSVTLGELQKGISKLEDGKQKTRLETWFTDDLRSMFRGRTLVLDDEVMIGWGQIYAFLEKNGVKVPVFDSLIAACAIANGCVLVTENTKDFKAMNVKLFNPWNGEFA
jgi:toxin FitB